MGIWTALRIPGVVPFAATLFFCKLVAYTFLFWLPYYLSSARIGARRLSPQVGPLRKMLPPRLLPSHSCTPWG